jgi:hypothetical protein
MGTATAEEQQQQVAAAWAKMLADRADKRRCHEAAALAKAALVKECHC